MTRCVDDIDLDPLVGERDVLGQDRDPSLALQVARIKDPFSLELGGPELPALTQQAVDQGCFPVVDMGDDDQVADISTERFPLS